MNPLSPILPPKPLRVLAFDLENRPLSYWYDGNCTAEITAIAASFVGEEKVYCWLLGDLPSAEMLRRFLILYDQADVVSGHYIRKHDLPLLSGALLELGLPKLKPKLASDTHGDLIRRGGISVSQESLAAMFGLPEPKQYMNQSQWREANRLTPAGLKATKARVVADVFQHKALRKRLLEAGALKAPRLWAP